MTRHQDLTGDLLIFARREISTPITHSLHLSLALSHYSRTATTRTPLTKCSAQPPPPSPAWRVRLLLFPFALPPLGLSFDRSLNGLPA